MNNKEFVRRIADFRAMLDLYLPAGLAEFDALAAHAEALIVVESVTQDENMEIIRVPKLCIPKNSKLVEAYETKHQIVVCGNVNEEDDPDHNCDAMGCGSMSHVVYRFDKPEKDG